MNNFGIYNHYYDRGGEKPTSPKPFDPNNPSKEDLKKLKKIGYADRFGINGFINAASSYMPEKELENATLDDYINVYNTFNKVSKMNGGAGFGAGQYGYENNEYVDKWKDYINKGIKIHGNGKVVGFEEYSPEQLEGAMFNKFAHPGEVALRNKNWYDTWIPFMNQKAREGDFSWFNENSSKKYEKGNEDPYMLQSHGDSTLIKDPKTGLTYEVLTMKGHDGSMEFIPAYEGIKNGIRTQRVYDPNYNTPVFGNADQDQYMDAYGYKINTDFAPRAQGNLPEQPLKNPIRLQKVNAYGGRTSRRLYAAGGSMGMIPMGEQEDYNMVGAGGSHEQNPMGGVPYGMNADGSQNMVEQGEASVGNQVFSDRSSLSPELCQQLGLPEGTSPSQAMQQIEALYEQGQISDEEYQEIQNVIFQDQEMQKQNSGASYQQGGVGGPGVEGIDPNMVGAGQQFAYGGFRGYRY